MYFIFWITNDNYAIKHIISKPLLRYKAMKTMSKVVFISGASSGFGKATAELLASKGYIVYGTSRKSITHSQIHYLYMDLQERESVRKAIERIVEEQGRIDVAINNAGMGIGGSLELATDEEIDIQMDTNFRGCVSVCQHVLPVMRKQGGGQIINLSSIGGIMGLPYQGYYSASKFAIEGFTEALAAEVRGFGIKVSMVEPGDFATNFTARRKISEATQKSAAYGDSFARSLSLIEKEENGGLRPEKLAKTVEKIIRSRRPRLRYVVANFEQKLSVLLKRIIPGNWMVSILRNYYKV